MGNVTKLQPRRNEAKQYKAQWITALRKCKVIHGTAFRIGNALIYEWANHETLKCIVKYSTIADETGCSTKTVQRCIKALERAGFLRVERFNGHSNACKFFFDLPNNNISAHPQKKRVDISVHPKPQTEWTYMSDRVDICVHGNKPEPINLSNLHTADAEAQNFDEFISKYPRKGDVKKSKAAYDTAIAAGITHKHLLYAVHAYSQENSENIENRKVAFLKYPNLWLKERYYDRYPMPKSSANMELRCGVSPATIKGIQEGKIYMCRNVSASQAQALIDAGHVTRAQCSSAGVMV